MTYGRNIYMYKTRCFLGEVMDPKAYSGYTISRKEWLDKANALLNEAKAILNDTSEIKEDFAKREIHLSEVDCLNKALEKAEEGVSILKDHAPDSINDVYVIDKINAKIKKLTAPKPKPKPKEVPKEILEPVVEPVTKPPQQVIQTVQVEKPKKSKKKRWE